EPQIGAIAHRAGDRFLICSDGIVDGLWDRQVEEIVRAAAAPPGPGAAQELVEQAVLNSGRDNTTAVVVEIAEPARADPVP
ncbi:MAG TPA: serine/threonine-protein phosphatase, partial [Opitutaceae bacterium]|nr:serine/threonine-protein phosphatase [Opitutaceae bacterium]